MQRVLGTALAEFHRDEFVAVENLFADEQRLVFGRRDLGSQTRRLALVGHDDTGHRIHILLQGDVSPHRSPEAHARNGNDHAAIAGLEDRELARGKSARQVVEQGENIARILHLPPLGIDHIRVDELVVGLALRGQRAEDGLLLLVEFVLRLTFLKTQRGQRQQRGHDDDHHRRIEHDIGVAVRIAEQPLLTLQLREFRGGSAADGAGVGRGRSFVDVAADVAFELFLSHISHPILQF